MIEATTITMTQLEAYKDLASRHNMTLADYATKLLRQAEQCIETYTTWLAETSPENERYTYFQTILAEHQTMRATLLAILAIVAQDGTISSAKPLAFSSERPQGVRMKYTLYLNPDYAVALVDSLVSHPYRLLPDKCAIEIEAPASSYDRDNWHRWVQVLMEHKRVLRCEIGVL